jgi:hypothetical protein
MDLMVTGIGLSVNSPDEAAGSAWLVWFLLILNIHVPCTFLYPSVHGLYAPMTELFPQGPAQRFWLRWLLQSGVIQANQINKKTAGIRL